MPRGVTRILTGSRRRGGGDGRGWGREDHEFEGVGLGAAEPDDSVTQKDEGHTCSMDMKRLSCGQEKAGRDLVDQIRTIVRTC